MAKDIFISRIIKKYIDQIIAAVENAGATAGKPSFVKMPATPTGCKNIIALNGCPQQSGIILNSGQTQFVDGNGSDNIIIDQDDAEYMLIEFVPDFYGTFGAIFPLVNGLKVVGYDFASDPCAWIEYSYDNGNTWTRISYINVLPVTAGMHDRRYYAGPFPALAGEKIKIRLLTGAINSHCAGGTQFPHVVFSKNDILKKMCIYYEAAESQELINCNRGFPSFGMGANYEFYPTKTI